MSIVQDALKKVETYRLKSEPRHKENIVEKGAEPKSSNLNVNVNIGIAPFKKGLIRVLILSFIALLLFISLIAMTHLFMLVKGKLKAGTNASSPISIETNIPAVKQDINTEIEKAAEPYQEPLNVFQVKPQEHQPQFVLSGVMYLENTRRAIINGAVVEEGDTVTGARIVKIGEDSVIVRIDDNKDIKLNLKR